jgi:hypothetical protein
MLALRDFAGLSQADREALEREAGQLQTIHEVVAWGRVAGVIVQDEFTHDIVVQRGRSFLVFDST